MSPSTSVLFLLGSCLALACSREDREQALPSSPAPATLELEAEPTSQRRLEAVGQLGPGRGTLVIDLEPAPGTKLSEGAPLRLRGEGKHIGFPEPIRTVLALKELPLRFPIVVSDGATGPAVLNLTYYTCSHGKDAACRPEHAVLTVDLDLSGSGEGGEAHLVHHTGAAGAPPPPALVPAAKASGTQRTPLELEAELARSCSVALEKKQKVLLDFGADWCPDCRVLHAMKQAEPLLSELGHWQAVDIDITDPERHADLMTAFNVKAIARWVVLEPQDCAQPVTAWVRGPSRVVEPTQRGGVTSQALSAWLRQSRP